MSSKCLTGVSERTGGEVKTTDSQLALGRALPAAGCGQQVASSDPRPGLRGSPKPSTTPAPPRVTSGQLPPPWLPARCFHLHANKKPVVWLVSEGVCARPKGPRRSSPSTTSLCPIRHKVTLPGSPPAWLDFQGQQ